MTVKIYCVPFDPNRGSVSSWVDAALLMVYMYNSKDPIATLHHNYLLGYQMKKQKSTRETKNMIQTALWLPRGMHEKLKPASGERGLGEEIRRRLQKSFDAEQLPRDPISDELLDAIKQIEGNLDEPWHANRFAYDVFKAAINELLSNYQPSSEAQPGTGTKLQSMYGLEKKPESIGQILAHVAFKACVAKRPVVDLQKG